MDDFTLNKCNDVMSKIRSHPISEMFLEPVDPERDGAPDYFKQIKKPMDLGTIQNKLNTRAYKNVQEWKDDMNLICTNAIQYNGKKSYIGAVATEISKVFKELSRTISDGPIMTWYSTLLEIKRDYKNHALAWISREQGETDISFANPKLQTKDVDTQPEVHRFLMKSMPIEELEKLREAILKETRPEVREDIKTIVSKHCPEMIETGPIDMNLLPPAALIQLKELLLV